jgi:O-antigen ligase
MSPVAEYRAVYPTGSWQAAFLLQLFTISAFMLPTDTVIRVIGAQGYVASLLAMGLFILWVLTAVFGFHDPLQTRHPTRGALGLLWIASLLSFAAMPYYGPNQTQRLSAERWIMLLIGMAGVILTAAEHLRAPQDIMRVIRTVVWGGAFSGAVAVVQFWGRWDLMPYVRMALLGFDRNAESTNSQARGALLRVSGTANHPIEFGVVAAMLLPLSIWLGLNDTDKSKIRRWVPVALISVCIPVSVSRSAVLATLVSVGVFVVLLPPVQRAWIFACVPVFVVVVFATTPGYLRTISESFTAGKNDSSITNRLDNYPRVIAAFKSAPVLGHGGGTDIQPDLTKVLDNQYLKSTIELGMLGVLALVLYFVVPAVAALTARQRTRDPALRALCAALAGGSLAAAVGSYTFDAFSFAQFASAHALVVGLCGTCWIYVQRLSRASPEHAMATRLSG